MKITERDLMVARAVLDAWAPAIVRETIDRAKLDADLAALLESLPEPAEHEQAARKRPPASGATKHTCDGSGEPDCAACDAIDDRENELHPIINPIDGSRWKVAAEHEPAAQDVERKFGLSGDDFCSCGALLEPGDEQLCDLCAARAEGARVERERRQVVIDALCKVRDAAMEYRLLDDSDQCDAVAANDARLVLYAELDRCERTLRAAQDEDGEKAVCGSVKRRLLPGGEIAEFRCALAPHDQYVHHRGNGYMWDDEPGGEGQ